ncbi:hypothetical protein Xind_03900 [Xenorhabdus indica]|nr:hypothetical protein [Xenorhabdus indica]
MLVIEYYSCYCSWYCSWYYVIGACVSGNCVAQPISPFCLRQHHDWCCVFEHIHQSLGWIDRIERYISPSSFENGKQPYHHLQTACHTNCNTVVRANAQCDQMMSQTIGSVVQFFITERLLSAYHSRCTGSAGNLSFNQLVNQGILWKICLGSIEVH